MQCLLQMLASDRLRLLQVGQGTGDLEQPVSRAQGQCQPLAGMFQPAFIGLRQPAMLTQPWQIQKRVGAALAFFLPFSSVGNLCGRRRGVIAGRLGGVQRRGFTRDRQVQIDPVQQRPGQLLR